MCGIAGIIGIDKNEGYKEIQNMLDSIKHRGPDDQGIWFKNNAIIGMKRLSIVDIKYGFQPVVKNDDIGLVFNGEIYNHKEIKEKLIAKGYEFKTNGEAEVIINLYKEYGIEGIQLLNGMFAIAILHRSQNKLFLIRDRLGIKPLYYTFQKNTFIFASEIKAFKGLQNISLTLNKNAINDYLTLRFIPTKIAIWEEINKINAGEVLTFEIKKRKYSIKKYWKINFNSLPNKRNHNYQSEFNYLFNNAVKKRVLSSDVPVGIFLSGGLDSSAIAASLYELGIQNLHSFSVRFSDEDDFDESNYAFKVAKKFKTNHHLIDVTKDQFIEFLPTLVKITDEPLADLSCIPLYFLSEYASKYVKVVLSGEGADEIFAGYDFNNARKKQYLFWPIKKSINFLNLNNLFGKIGEIKKLKILKIFADLNSNNIHEIHASHITNYLTEYEKLKIWKNEKKSSLKYSTHQLIRGWYKKTYSNNFLDKLQEVYTKEWLVENLLMKADKITMANSLELRVPFLDHELVEWAEKLPIKKRIGSFYNSSTKYMIRKYAKDRLPKIIIDRKKMGFPSPAYKWIMNSSFNWAKSTLLNEKSKLLEILDKSFINYILEKTNKGDIKYAHKTWTLIILHYWLEEWT